MDSRTAPNRRMGRSAMGRTGVRFVYRMGIWSMSVILYRNPLFRGGYIFSIYCTTKYRGWSMGKIKHSVQGTGASAVQFFPQTHYLYTRFFDSHRESAPQSAGILRNTFSPYIRITCLIRRSNSSSELHSLQQKRNASLSSYFLHRYS